MEDIISDIDLEKMRSAYRDIREKQASLLLTYNRHMPAVVVEPPPVNDIERVNAAYKAYVISQQEAAANRRTASGGNLPLQNMWVTNEK